MFYSFDEPISPPEDKADFLRQRRNRFRRGVFFVPTALIRGTLIVARHLVMSYGNTIF